MISPKMFQDILKYDVPIILLGDPLQLPPIGSNDLFGTVQPDISLTQIHRQAAESPIIKLATMARECIPIPLGEYGPNVRKIRAGDLPGQEFINADVVLVGRNETRKKINAHLRATTGRTSDLPEPGEKLIVLRNMRNLGLLNGMLCTATDPAVNTSNAHVFSMGFSTDDDGNIFDNQNVLRDEFQPVLDAHGQVIPRDPKDKDYPITLPTFLRTRTAVMDFAYAITTHKAQGSQFDYVIIVDESQTFGVMAHRWLYTAITRAIDKLVILQL
jgi:exodeoxyribonuclease-5